MLRTPPPLSASSSAALTRNMLSESLARGVTGTAWENDDKNNDGGVMTEDEGLMLRITAWAGGKMQRYHARDSALRRSWEAAKLVAYHTRGILANVLPLNQRQKTLEEKALVGAIVADYAEARFQQQ